MAAFFVAQKVNDTSEGLYKYFFGDESMYPYIFQKQEDNPRRTSVFLVTSGWDRGESADLT